MVARAREGELAKLSGGERARAGCGRRAEAERNAGERTPPDRVTVLSSARSTDYLLNCIEVAVASASSLPGAHRPGRRVQR